MVLDDPEVKIKAPEEKESPKKSSTKSIEQLSVKALKSLLDKALEKEDYENRRPLATYQRSPR